MLDQTATPVPTAAGHWTLDPTTSSASFTVSNFGFKEVHGTIPIRSASVSRAVSTSASSCRKAARTDAASAGRCSMICMGPANQGPPTVLPGYGSRLSNGPLRAGP